MKRLLILVTVIGFMMASFVTPLRAQWNVAYSGPQGPENLYFLDSLHGWFPTVPTMGTDKVLRTTDGGFTFEPQYVPFAVYNLYCIFFEDTLNGWVAGGPYGGTGPGTILKTTDGGTNWVLMSHPAPKCAWNVITKAGNTVLFGGGYDANGGGGILMKTTNGGGSWTFAQYPISSGYGGISDMVAFNELNFVVGGNKGFLARTTDGGVTWIEANLNQNYEVRGIRFVDNNLGYALVTDGPYDSYLYKTIDGGFIWNEHYSWIGQGWKPALSVISGTNVIFVGGWLDGAGSTYGILKSVDGGATWNVVFQITNDHIRRIFALDEQHAWATGAFIYRYDYEPPQNLPPYFITVVPDTAVALVGYVYDQLVEANDPDNDTLSFVALQLPNFLTLQQGSYRPIYSANVQGTPAISDTGYHTIEIEVVDGKGGSDTLSWILYVDNVTSAEAEKLPTRFELFQNYPNPFNPSTVISYRLPVIGFVTLKVYDLLGREVATLVNEEKPAGKYEVEFSAICGSASGGNAYDLLSGIYFYQLKAGDYVETKKMVLLR